jgi:glutaredoxin 3
MSETVIYTKTGCPYCQRAINHYRQRKEKIKEINVSEDSQAMNYIKSKYGATKVPVIVEGEKLVSIGYEGGG